jgi:hypothetical protein
MSAQIRDIHIDLTNSCNCCFPHRNPVMYVHETGVATPYQRSHSYSLEEAMKSSIQNLELLIKANALAFGAEFDALKSDLEQKVEVALDEHSPPRITLRLIEKINDAIKDILLRGSNERT